MHSEMRNNTLCMHVFHALWHVWCISLVVHVKFEHLFSEK